MHATIWKFERKNSQEYHHMVCNGATNRSVEKGLVSPFLRQESTPFTPLLSSLSAPSSQPNLPNAISNFKTREDHCFIKRYMLNVFLPETSRIVVFKGSKEMSFISIS